jgi:hypothetical protein
MQNEVVQTIVKELSLHGIRHTKDFSGSGHVRIAWQTNQFKPMREYYAPSTPSDNRSRLNARAEVRRFLTADGVDITAKAVREAKPPGVFAKALQLPSQEPVVSLTDQVKMLRAEISDLTDLILGMAALVPVAVVAAPVAEPTPEPVIETLPVEIAETSVPILPKKGAHINLTPYLRRGTWKSVADIAKESGLPNFLVSRKLQWLKHSGIAEISFGLWRKTKV